LPRYIARTIYASSPALFTEYVKGKERGSAKAVEAKTCGLTPAP
jgi:hypothetical protein